MKSKKILSLALAGAMTLAMAVPAFAANEETTTDPNVGAKSTVTATVAATTFSVTVPTTLAINVAADGQVTAASENVQIINNSTGKIKVTSVKAEGTNEWNVVANTTEFNKLPVGSKKIALTINDADVYGDENTVAGTFQSINGKTVGAETGVPQNFTYKAAIGAQKDAITDSQEVAKITFTVAWDDGSTTTEP